MHVHEGHTLKDSDTYHNYRDNGGTRTCDLSNQNPVIAGLNPRFALMVILVCQQHTRACGFTELVTVGDMIHFGLSFNLKLI